MALVRLGHKYDFRDLLDSVVERITLDNPKTLAEYDIIVADGAKHIAVYPGMHFDLTVLARENNILSALPSLYYRATLMGLVSGTRLLDCHPDVLGQERLLNGVSRPDGTLASLSPVDLHRCIQGREKLLHAPYQEGKTLGWLRGWDGTACVAVQCVQERVSILLSCLNRIGLRCFTVLPPDTLQEMCPECRSRVHELFQAGRKKMWEDLPGYFGLPPWDELKNDL